MAIGLYVVGLAGSVDNLIGSFKPGWVKAFDADAFEGRGELVVTSNPDEALVFPDAPAAVLFYMTRSKVQPTRIDGLPNRPLRAFSVEVRPL